MSIGNKEKERTEKYEGILAKRLKGIADFWQDIMEDLSRKEKELSRILKSGIQESGERTD